MRRFLVGILFLPTLLVSGRAFAQVVNPKVVAKIVADGRVRFSATKCVTVWLDGGQEYSICPVTVQSNESHEYLSSIQAEVQMYTARADRASVAEGKVASGGKAEAVAFQAGPHPPPPPPPKPVNHSGPRPPAPVPPKPSNHGPTPHERPAKSIAQLAAEGAIVGSLVTDGISQPNWTLPKGAYTMVLVSLEGKPVAALVNDQGDYVASLDNVFFMNAIGQDQK